MGEISIAGRSRRYGNRIMSVQDDDDDIHVETGTMLAGAILQKDIPEIHSTADTKLSWLRYQTIGQVAEIDTPFGKRQLTYADHTASGRCLQYVEDYIIQNVFPFYGNTHTSDSYVGEHTGKIYHEATEFIKKCLGGAQDDALFFCGSGTTAAIKRLQEVMGIAISSILKEKVLNSCLKIEERWVVFVGPYEHHSNVLSWRQSLAEVIEIGLDDEGLIDINSLKRQLQIYQRTGRPMLGSFSACSNVTGIVSDTRSISSLLHLFGAFACFDFAASGPYVEIDMRSGAIDGYDAVFLSPHKFLGGPGTPGVLLMNKALYQLKNSPPSTCGGGTVNYVNYFNEKDTLYVNDIEEREDAGTPQIIQRVKAALAFQVKEYIGYKVIADKEHEYATRALERLGKNRNIWVLGNTKVERQAIISFLVYTTKSSSGVERVDDKVDERINIPKYEARYKKDKPLDGAFVAKLLNDLFGIQSRGGCACAGPYGHYLLGIGDRLSLEMRSAIEKGYNGAKSGWTRVSFPYYMSNEEFEFILSALEFIATYGQRFLPFYEFNWITGSWTFKTNAFEEKFKKEKGCKLCASFSTNPSKELKAKDKNRRSCMHMGLAMYAYDYAKQVKDNYWSTPKSTDDHIHMQAMYAFYLEVARHVGNVLPKYPAGSTIPEGVNPNSVFFRV